jgi:hypothetical protein
MMERKLTGSGWARGVWMVVSVDVEVEFVLGPGSGLLMKKTQKTTSEPKRSKGGLLLVWMKEGPSFDRVLQQR